MSKDESSPKKYISKCHGITSEELDELRRRDMQNPDKIFRHEIVLNCEIVQYPLSFFILDTRNAVMLKIISDFGSARNFCSKTNTSPEIIAQLFLYETPPVEIFDLLRSAFSGEFLNVRLDTFVDVVQEFRDAELEVNYKLSIPEYDKGSVTGVESIFEFMHVHSFGKKSHQLSREEKVELLKKFIKMHGVDDNLV